MPLKRMPNGEYVEIPDGISPEALAKIESQFKPTRAQKREQAQRGAVQAQRKPTVPELARAQRQKSKERRESTALGRFSKAYSDNVNPLNWFGGLGGAGLLFNFDDELSGVGGGLRSVIEGKSFREGYDVSREARNQEKAEARTRNPVMGTVAEIGGSLLNPIGTGARALTGTGKIISKVAPRAGNVVTRAGQRVQNAGAITQGVATGVTTGTLNAAGSSESMEQLPGDAGAGALAGGLAGGVFGTVARGGQGALRILRDRSPAKAQDVAYQNIAQALERAEITPEQASKSLNAANRKGGDAMLMDVSPNLTSMALNLSRNPNLKTANRMIERGEQRARSRGGRIAGKIERTAKLPDGIRDFDALREADDLMARRTGKASVDYAKGGSLDNNFDWTDELRDAVREAPNFERMMNRAFDRARQFGDDLGVIAEGEVIPSMRVWNYLKKAYDEEIGPLTPTATNKGNREAAAAWSAELGRIKELIAQANPAYEKILATQRDFFQRENALKQGVQLWKDLAKSPRKTARALKAMSPKELDEARVGMIDKLIEDVITSKNPLSVLDKVMNDNNITQRKVLEIVFGDKKRYNEFVKYLKTEVAGQRSDSVTRYGGQSITSRAQQAGGAVDGDLAELGVGGVAGTAFGGLAGGVANIARGLMSKAKITSEDAQDEIAKLLMSKGGKDFIESIKNAVAYKKAQVGRNKALTELVAKSTQQAITTQIGGE